MDESDREALIERFWELQEPDPEAYSNRIENLLNMITVEQLDELVSSMDWDDEQDGVD